MSALFDKHEATLKKAIDACKLRYSWTAYPESPSSKIHGVEVPKVAKAAFEQMLGKPFAIELPGTMGQVGEEVSPYTEEPLGISYPKVSVDRLFDAI